MSTVNRGAEGSPGSPERRARRPASLTLADPEQSSPRQRLQGPAFTTLLSPGGGTRPISPLPQRYQHLTAGEATPGIRMGYGVQEPDDVFIQVPVVFKGTAPSQIPTIICESEQADNSISDSTVGSRKDKVCHQTARPGADGDVAGQGHGALGEAGQCSVERTHRVEDSCSPQARERDMDGAIQWIKQELMLMKQQDRLLMRQLLNLRSQIHQIRSNRQCLTTYTDLYSSDDSWVSFASDEALSAPCTNSPVTEAEMLASFRDRTIKMMSVPSSPVELQPSNGLGGSMPKLKMNSLQAPKLGKIDITYYV